jgi:hypothetical protein
MITCSGRSSRRCSASVPLPGTSPAEVTRWLATLARHLQDQQRHGGSGTDIDLHLLWTAAGTRTPRYLAAAAQCLVIAMACAPAFWIAFTSLSAGGSLLFKIVMGAYVGQLLLIPVLIVLKTNNDSVDLRRFDLAQLRTPAGRRRLKMAAVTGYRKGRYLPKGGPIFVPLAAMLNAVTHRAGAVSHPRMLVRQGLLCDLAILLLPASVISLASCVGVGFSPIYFATIFGITLLPALLFTVRSPWLPYFFGTMMLARRDLLPRRPARFLDWAYTAGLTRMSGISIQFRHRDLQNLLISTETPTTEPVVRS